MTEVHPNRLKLRESEFNEEVKTIYMLINVLWLLSTDYMPYNIFPYSGTVGLTYWLKCFMISSVHIYMMWSLDTSGINNSQTRTFVLAHRLSCLIMDYRPNSFQFPFTEIIIEVLLRNKVRGKHMPLTSIKYGIQNISNEIFLTLYLWLYNIFYNLPQFFKLGWLNNCS